MVKERENVMVQVMEVQMMAMMDVREILSVEAITASSLEVSTMKKTTAVRNHRPLLPENHPQLFSLAVS